MAGSRTVWIGEMMVHPFLGKPELLDNDEDRTEPSKEEKIKIIKHAIEDCFAALERKLTLLIQNDSSTLMAFKKWFGYTDESRKQVIEERIKKQLDFCKSLTLAWILVHELSHFKSIGRTRDYAYDEDCETLAVDKPDRALYNADSFAYFIIL